MVVTNVTNFRVFLEKNINQIHSNFCMVAVLDSSY